MTAIDALWTQLKARHTAFTALSAECPEFVRESDSRQNFQTDSITVSMNWRRESSDLRLIDVTMTVRTRRFDDFVDQADALVDLAAAFHEWKPAQQGVWFFSQMLMVGEAQQRSDEAARYVSVRFVVFASLATVPLFGSDADITNYNGGRVFKWQYESLLRSYEDTPLTVDKVQYTTGERLGRGQMLFLVTAVPPKPDEYADVVFTLSTGVTITRDIIVTGVDLLASVGDNDPIVVRASFVVNGGDEDGF